MSRTLGIDHGTKRIGIAMSDEGASIAFGSKVLDAGKNSIKEIASIVKTESVSVVVVGYPLNMKGQSTQQTGEVDKFLAELRNSLPENVAIEKWDERLTSKMAESFVIDSGMKKKKRQDKSNLDMLSAVFILQSYLDNKKQKSI